MNLSLFVIRVNQAQAIMAAFTVIPQLVQQVEQVAESLIPQGVTMPGLDKLEMVKAKVTAYLASAGFELGAIKDVLPELVDVINGWVTTFHSIGLFKKASGLKLPAANAAA